MTPKRSAIVAIIAAAFTGLSFITYAATFQWAVVYAFPIGGQRAVCGIGYGALVACTADQHPREFTGLLVHSRESDEDQWYWFPRRTSTIPPYATGFLLPLWIPLLLGVLATIVAARAARKRPDACCVSCGYDLTDSAQSLCPECGTPVPTQA